MKKSRYLQRMISAMLLLAMVICQLPTNVIALPVLDADATAQLNSGFSELTSLREENVKHFSLGNGTYQAVVYGHPVHYQDENGTWQDIDNTLTLQTVNGTQQYTNDRVAFAPTYRANAQLMRLQKGDYSISMSLISNASASTMSTTNISSSNAAVTNANKQIASIDQAMNASWSSNVKYENVLTNVDLEYIVDYDYVKENIIVKAPRASYDFSFRLNLEGMYAALLSDGSVGIYSNETNAMEYAIPTPYMYDARGRFSDAVTYSLTGTSGKYVLTVSADEAWMEEEDRAFPVTIDPTYTTTRVSLDHTYTATYSPSTPQVSPSVLWVSADETTYIKPTENITIPSDMVLISATLDTYYFFDDPYITDVIPVGAYEMLYEWDEDTATYNTMSAYPNRGKSTTLYDYELCVAGTTATVSNPRKASFDVTEVMAGWLNGEDQNGIVLDYYYGYDPNVSEWYVGFHSIFAQYAYRPMFTYTYTLDYVASILLGQTKTKEDLGLTHIISQLNPSGQALSWYSSNSNVAKIENLSDGIVRGVSCGEVTITATASGSTILAYTLRVCRYANFLITNDGDFSGISFEMSPGFSPYGAATYLKMISPNVVEEKKPYDKGFSKDEMIEYLKLASVVYIVAHGEQKGIIIDKVTGLMLTMNDLSGVDLSNLDLVVLLSCETAKGGYSESNVTNNTPSNFMEQLRCCGVKTVVGFDEWITHTQFAKFAAELTRLLVGKSDELNKVTNEYDDIPKLTVQQAINNMKNNGNPAPAYDIVKSAIVGEKEDNTTLGD